MSTHRLSWAAIREVLKSLKYIWSVFVIRLWDFLFIQRRDEVWDAALKEPIAEPRTPGSLWAAPPPNKGQWEGVKALFVNLFCKYCILFLNFDSFFTDSRVPESSRVKMNSVFWQIQCVQLCLVKDIRKGQRSKVRRRGTCLSNRGQLPKKTSHGQKKPVSQHIAFTVTTWRYFTLNGSCVCFVLSIITDKVITTFENIEGATGAVLVVACDGSYYNKNNIIALFVAAFWVQRDGLLIPPGNSCSVSSTGTAQI